MTVSVEGFSDSSSAAAALLPITSFQDLKVTKKVKPLFASFKDPSPIQQYAWPALLSKRDVVGISATGSGKTLAFSVPILHRLLKSKQSEDGTVQWVTIAPTRELALQTFEVIKSVVSAVCLYGGVPKRDQVKEMARVKPLAVVATPGRLQDLIDSEEVDLSKVRFLVLDEADRMLDAGFEPAVSRIVSAIPPTDRRQTVLFSATWPSSVQTMAKRYCTDPVKITICDGRPLHEPQANLSITQSVIVCEPHDKDRHLLSTLRQFKNQKVIVFVLYKREAPRVEQLLKRQSYKVCGLHGDMSQHDRTNALESFKSGTVDILIATDVAARGLDIPAVALVFNYTFPLTIEDYVHRIGRTGRGGATGTSITLFTALEKHLAGALQNVLKQAGQSVPQDLLAFGSTTKKRVHSEYGAFYKEDDGREMPLASRIKFGSDDE